MSISLSDSSKPQIDSEERPWGSWQVMGAGDGYKIKRIGVSPHSRLSLQTHEYRSEHWLVVTGSAVCTVGGAQFVANQGDSIDVACGVAHRMVNAQDEELIVIEVQLGPYTGEDDIVRLEDDYGR